MAQDHELANELDSLQDYPSLQEQCRQFANILGLTDPVPERVLLAALAKPEYAQNLLICRSDRRFLQRLIEHPPPLPEEREPTDSLSNGQILKQAAASLWKWSKAGFAVVDKETLAKRRNACMTCPHLTEPPEKLLYKLTNSQKENAKICGLCGCPVMRKTRLPGEVCPDTHPDDPALNRWGEAKRDKTRHVKAPSSTE